VSVGPTGPATVPGPKVFITYRREDTAAHAGRLYDAMVARFGEDNVFMDVDMAPGVDFVERITEAVAACHVLIVVMGPSWATVEDERGTARLADPEDFVRLEVETALRRTDVTPIPVLVAGARMPNREDLPPELRPITRRNALELGDQRWRYDVERLISTLDELLAESPLVPGSPSPERSVTTGKATPADAGQAAPPSTVAGTTSVESRPAAPWALGGRRMRWALLGVLAVAALVVAVIVAVDGGGPSTQAATFTKDDLPKLVLPAEDAPGNLNLSQEQSGPYVKGQPHADADSLQFLSETNGQGYISVFTAPDGTAQPYWYSESFAAVFADENAAERALDRLKGTSQPGEDISARGLGDDGFGVLVTGVPRAAKFNGSSWEGSAYHYVWRTGNLLQTFDLTLSGAGVSEATARRSAQTMDARTE
jgi:hypothetical protein